ncbi:MAG: 2-oxo acid dehydrogenase subunit E2 [Kineosporiaceae bacterium]|nr:2-oxo acid dehydrogenase subunit E2 [Kineosporiaceae bacterium]MBK8074365.1 2-oxo acid dehydrogenase subunit E2 [Kineosporiaceae bacterium]
MLKEFRLPDAGEGLTEADIVTWRVQPGDTVAVNDIIVDIETAKSVVELPCPYAGVVAELLVAEGDTVPVGMPIIRLDTGDETDSGATDDAGVVEPERTPMLVGYGPRDGAAVRRRRVAAVVEDQPATEMAPVVELPPAAEISPQDVVAGLFRPLAKPPVRKLARDLGVDLNTVPPTGKGGVVTRQDVEAAADRAAAPTLAAAERVALHRETRVPVRGVRKLTAQAMVTSAFTAPHVTEWVQVDMTRTVKLLGRLRHSPEFAGVRLTPLVMVARALLVAVRRNPGINATWDAETDEIVTKHYVNLGIAAATPRGLLVPVIPDADSLGLRELAQAISVLAKTARDGRTQPAEMAGGTVTITNVGVFGVDGGTPILPPGQSAILAVGQVAARPWVHKGRVQPRQVTTLSLSFDHRIVDGELGSRVLADTAAILNDPGTALV